MMSNVEYLQYGEERKMELTKSETKVMMAIWEADHDMALPEIQALVNACYQKDWKPQTVSTFLTRLVRKGCLDMYRRGRSFFYHPRISLDDALTAFLEETASTWFHGDCQAMLQKAEELLGRKLPGQQEKNL